MPAGQRAISALKCSASSGTPTRGARHEVSRPADVLAQDASTQGPGATLGCVVVVQDQVPEPLPPADLVRTRCGMTSEIAQVGRAGGRFGLDDDGFPGHAAPIGMTRSRNGRPSRSVSEPRCTSFFSYPGKPATAIVQSRDRAKTIDGHGYLTTPRTKNGTHHAPSTSLVRRDQASGRSLGSSAGGRRRRSALRRSTGRLPANGIALENSRAIRGPGDEGRRRVDRGGVSGVESRPRLPQHHVTDGDLRDAAAGRQTPSVCEAPHRHDVILRVSRRAKMHVASRSRDRRAMVRSWSFTARGGPAPSHRDWGTHSACYQYHDTARMERR